MKNLSPTSSSRPKGKLEIAPRQRNGPLARDSFTRDAAPHTGLATTLRPTKSPIRRKNSLDERNRWNYKRGGDSKHKSWDEKHSPHTENYGNSPVKPGYRPSFNDHSRRSDNLTSQIGPNLRKKKTGYDSDRQALALAKSTTAYSRPHSYNVGQQSQKIRNPLPEFSFPVSPKATPQQLPTHFTSPPLMPGLLTSLHDVLGTEAQPTPIQALSLKHLFDNDGERLPAKNPHWKQFLLASETGSGKSIAYLLPVLQALKQSELQPSPDFLDTPSAPRYTLNPRALILAPTHELSRQLAGFAKALLHVIKLRVTCASRANVKNPRMLERTASKMAEEHETSPDGIAMQGEFGLQRTVRTHPVDVIVGTPTRLLEMIRGKGWNREDEEERDLESGWDLDEKGRKIRTIPKRVRRGEPEMGLEKVEWVVVDEADVLFGDGSPLHLSAMIANITPAWFS